jgi:Zn-dependent protease
MPTHALYGIALIALPFVMSLTVHEWGHARAALAFGDKTALIQGRLSLNPLVHLDLMGTVMMLFGPIGWAKPVPVDFSRLKPARIGDICVSLAGVGMNLLVAIGCLAGLYMMSIAGLRIEPEGDPTAVGIVAFWLSFGLILNLSLLFFNIIPLFPLDGHHVLRELLPWQYRGPYMDWQMRVGRLVLWGLIGLPWLAHLVGLRLGFNPVGTYFGYVQRLALLPLRGHALEMFFDSWIRYGPYLPW